jgi:FAD-dependent oxidoreductase family protein
MRSSRKLTFALLVLFGVIHLAAGQAVSFTPQSVSPAKLKDRYDVIVAGAGTGGCGAAIQAARLGVSVLLLEETDWIGGQMNAAAVTSMDEGGTLVRQRGLYRELVARIEAHYSPLGINAETAYHFGHICVEPRVGRKILHEMLDAAHGAGTLDLSLRSRVTKVLKSGDTITGAEIEIVTDAGKESRAIASKVLIDATEWGDVIPLAGARYRVGNCTNDAIDLTRHVQDNTWTAVVKQYPHGVPAGFLITKAPPGYDDKVQQRFVKSLGRGDTIDSKAKPWTWATFIGYRGMPDSSRAGDSPPITRTHLNYNNDYPATVAEIEDALKRRATDREMRLRTLQLIYYFQNTLGFKDWAVANDEGYDTPYNLAEIDAWLRERPDLEPFRAMLYHFPVIPYVRESRRLVGLHTLCAREIDRRPGKRPVQFPTAVALGDYPVDMHGSMTPKYLELDLDRAEDIPDKFGGHGAGPFAIPFESFIPEKVDGFLPAEKNISQSRMANGATRLQPHTMLMGQAAGAIAALAVKNGVQPRAVDPVLVQRVLLDAGDPLNLTPLKDVARESRDWPAIQLTTVHGMLPLENGKFVPQRPVTAAELAGVLQQLSASAPPANPAEPVTRSAFAEALRLAMAGSKVKLEFASADADKAKPITRSEAAQVIAEFLELRAIAKTIGAAQTLAWTSLRPASAPARTDLTSNLLPDLQKLVERKIIMSTDYWLEHAVTAETCDGAQVAELLTRAAHVFEPAVAGKDAVNVLTRQHIIGSPDYWTKNAVPGGKCAGNNVATVIHNLARSEALKRAR